MKDWQFWLLIVMAIFVAGFGLTCSCSSPVELANDAAKFHDENILEESAEYLFSLPDLTPRSPE